MNPIKRHKIMDSIPVFSILSFIFKKISPS
jgi:hypothetical protein